MNLSTNIQKFPNSSFFILEEIPYLILNTIGIVIGTLGKYIKLK